MNKDLAGVAAVWRALFGGAGLPLTACLHVVKEAAENGFCSGFCVRLWRRAQFSMLHCWGIIARLRLGVCEGGTKKM